MATFNFDELVANQEKTISKGIAGTKILVYGGNNRGKSYQCSRISPKTFAILTEAGGSAMTCPKQPCDDWGTFTAIVNDFTKKANVEHRREQIDVILIDTAENLVAQSERAICSQFGVATLSEITGKQNGYLMARQNFSQQITKLCNAGFCVVFVAHEETVEKTDEITGETYTYIQPKSTSNEKGSMRMLRDLCDFTVYLKANPAELVDGVMRPRMSSALFVETRNVFARSRFDIEPVLKEFSGVALKKAIEDSKIKTAENENIGVSQFVSPKTETAEDLINDIKPLFVALGQKCPNEVKTIVAEELGNKKVSEATEADIVALRNIYDRMTTKAMIYNVEY